MRGVRSRTAITVALCRGVRRIVLTGSRYSLTIRGRGHPSVAARRMLRPISGDHGDVTISVFDLFSVGIGPSSSHTVGPMRAARTFAIGLRDDDLIAPTTRVRAELFGSLGATGHGHGSDRAVIVGLEGSEPETVDTKTVLDRVAAVRASGRIRLLGEHEVELRDDDLVLHRRASLPYHPNGMRFAAYDASGAVLRE